MYVIMPKIRVFSAARFPTVARVFMRSLVSCRLPGMSGRSGGVMLRVMLRVILRVYYIANR